jgi:hypothetical protein
MMNGIICDVAPWGDNTLVTFYSVMCDALPSIVREEKAVLDWMHEEQQ